MQDERQEERGRVVLIAGPTASGKSALAIRIARAIGGVVVNADSMQVYGDLRVLTARPSPEDEAAAPHRLFGEVDGAVNFSVGRYVEAVRPVLEEVEAGGRTPVLVGGTGLYFRALTEGLSNLPIVPESVRAAVRKAAGNVPTPELHRELTDRDPDTGGRLRPNDRQRVLRALEVLEASGRSLASFLDARQPALLAGRRMASIFVAPDRNDLRTRIDRRFAAMVAAGALEEVRALAARNLDPALPIMRAHGVPALLAHLGGQLSLDEAMARGQADTRSYSKRQFTWFRHQMPGFVAVAPESAEREATDMLART